MLQPVEREPHPSRPADETVAVARHQVREALAEPEVPMEPEAATHRVDHPCSTIAELDPLELQRGAVLRRRNRGELRIDRPTHWQVMTPSVVAGAAGAMLPLYIAQVSGYESGWVAVADQPPTVAFTIVSCTPFVVL